MKTKILFIIAFVFASISMYAQENTSIPTLFEVDSSNGNTKRSGPKMQGLANNPINLEVRKLKFPNLMEMARQKKLNNESPSYFQFSLPKGKKNGLKNILAVPKHIEVDDNGNYTYNAELFVKKNLTGDLTLIHEDGKNYGSFTIGDRYFRIESYEGKGDFLIEKDAKKLAKKACATEHKKKKKSKSSKSTSLGGLSAMASNSSSKIVRVLFLYTNAANIVSNPSQFANTAISEMNQALRNSKIYSSTLTAQNVGVINFNGLAAATPNPINDMEAAQTNNQIIALRNQHGADLVVVLINRNYLFGGLGGIAPLDDYGSASQGYVSFVEADVNTKTVGHEIGHMFGCRHDTDTRTGGNLPNNLSETAKGHQWYKRNCFFCQKLYRKSMVADGGTGGLPRLYYSNPNVTEESKSRGPTGTSSRNNYVQLKNATPVVSAYNGFTPMSVYITGPGTVNVGDNYTVGSSVQNCSGSKTYKWEKSTNGFSYYQVSTASSYNTYAYPYDGNLVYYKLRVTCNGQTITRTTTIYIEGAGGPYYAKSTLLDEDVPDLESGMVIYPNPASDEINYLSDFEEDSEVTIILNGIAPWNYSKELFKGRVSEGRNSLLFSISNVPQGLYQLTVIKQGRKVFDKRLLVSR